MRLSAVLETGRSYFLDAACGIAPEHAIAKPEPGGWSVVECIEHVIAVETRYLARIENGKAAALRRDSEKEMRLFAAMRSRLSKVQAPDTFRPEGRFAALADALAEFKITRDRSVRFVEDQGDALYSLFAKHPYFGDLNGAEWIQLIDAHTRRHADQIRETHEAVLTTRPAGSQKRSRAAAAKKAPAFRRDQPDLPAAFELPEDGADLLGGGELITLRDYHLQNAPAASIKAGALRVEGCILERIQLSDAQFGSAEWKDVRLIACDLSNVRAHRLAWLRVELIDCRMTGFTASAVECRDVLIRNGDLRYSQWQSGRFSSCEFENCNWQDADLQNADLTGSVFRSCELGRADLQGTKLQNTDFRHSELEGMLVGMTDLRGAIVDPVQAMILARVLGLQIKG